MKQKAIAYIVLSLVLVFPASAQLKYGIRAGVNSSNPISEHFTIDDLELDYKSSTKIGYHFGLIGQLKVINFVLQPEILFSTSKLDVKVTDPNADPDEKNSDTQKFNRLDIPVIAGFKIGPIKLQAGPIGSVMLRSKSDLLDDRGIEQTYKGMTFGYQAGVGLELTSLLLDVKYEGNLSKFGDGVTIRNETFNFDQRMNQWVFSLGFLF